MKRLTLVILFVLYSTLAFSAGNDANTALLLHMDADPFTDSSVGGTHGNATEVADVTLDEAVFKWTASGDFDGDSGFLWYADDTDWDIITSNTQDVTVDMWVKFANTAGLQGFISHGTNAANHWILFQNGTNGITFRAYVGDADIIETGWGAVIADANWHHIALVIVAGGGTKEIAVYKDGIQLNYTQDNSTANFANKLEIGEWYEYGRYFNGNMDEVRIQYSNYFEAAPNVGVTDDFSARLPDAPYSANGVSGSQIIIIK